MGKKSTLSSLEDPKGMENLAVQLARAARDLEIMERVIISLHEHLVTLAILIRDLQQKAKEEG